MAIVKFSRKEFEKYVKITTQTQEEITMFGTPIESIDENEIAIEVLPNRPDLLSLQGFLRAFLAFIGKKKGLRTYKVNKPEQDYEVTIHSSVKSVRPFTACAIVKGLKFDDEKIKEIIDVQEKIHATLGRGRRKIAIGIYPLEKIKLPIRYEARKPKDIKFIPLDSDREMSGFEILNEHSAGKEYGHLLIPYKRWPVFVDAAGQILSMPPIINSQTTGKVILSTRDVFVECSGFDFYLLKKTLNILVTMLADMGGSIYQVKLNYKRPELTPCLEAERLKLNFEFGNKLLGLQLKEKEIKNLLERMGYGYDSKSNEVLVPAWRIDILHEIDLIEDIAIAYGYNNFKPELPEIASIGEERCRERLKRIIAEVLVGLGFLEISCYHLLTKEDVKKTKAQEELIEVESSRTDYCILRPSLLHSMLKTLSQNTSMEYPQKLFEIGKVFAKNAQSETGIVENERLSIAIAPGNFTELKQVLDCLFRTLAFELKLEESSALCYIQGRTAKLLLDGKELGIMGELHPSILHDWHLKMPTAYCELNLDFLFEKIIQPT